MNKFIIILLAILILGGGVWWYVGSSQATLLGDTAGEMNDASGAAGTYPEGTDGMDTDMGGGIGDGALPLYSSADVAAHASAESCWSIIDDAVYDLTDWTGTHPGGEEAILGLCGVDGSAAFHGKHGQSLKQANILATMKVGILAQ